MKSEYTVLRRTSSMRLPKSFMARSLYTSITSLPHTHRVMVRARVASEAGGAAKYSPPVPLPLPLGGEALQHHLLLEQVQAGQVLAPRLVHLHTYRHS